MLDRVSEWSRRRRERKETLTTARELEVKESEGEAARGGVRPGGVLRPVRSENDLPPVQTEEKGEDRAPPRCKSPNCFCLAAANCCGSLLTTWSLVCVSKRDRRVPIAF